MTSLFAILGMIVFCLVLLAGVLATLLGLPGTILILADTLVYAAVHHWQKPSWGVLAVLVGLSLLAEISDNLLSMLATRTGGGDTRTSLMALIGGISGGLVGSWLAPLAGAAGLLGGPFGVLVAVVVIPLTLAVIGGYVTAYTYERRMGVPAEEAHRAGKGALLGRLLGGLAKCLLAIIMTAIVLVQVFHR
jgi:uncharacterized protein